MLIQPYVRFEGKAREALTFYHSIFGGELHIMTVGEAPPGSCVEGTDPNTVMHGAVKAPEAVLMGTDMKMPGQGAPDYSSFTLSIECKNKEQLDEVYARLSEGGAPFLPAHQPFWGGWFAMVTDQFGISWMVSAP